MRLQVCLLPPALLLALSLALDNCGRQDPPPNPAPAPPAAEEPAVPPESGQTAGLRSRLEVRWEEGPPVSKLSIDYMVENTGAAPVALGFRNSGRVCGVVRDAEGREVHRFPQITLQVMGEENFPPGEARLFRYEVRRGELGESLSLSYTVEAWLCGYEALKQQATAKVRAAL
ncbi:MAG: BsuPI-related putative proteinase inhibitor [Candidatus Acidiferrales bacterium]